nr:MAG TPA: tail protein [Caudoviricetes sp.]
MQIFDDEKRRICTLTGYKDRKIVETLASGDKEMTFQYPANGRYVEQLKEEYYIKTKEDIYVIRAIKSGEQYNEYTAQLNVEELEAQAFPYGFASKEQTIRACLEFAFNGTGWTVGKCTITKKRTIDRDDIVTAWEILQDCLNTYRCECKIDTINKIVNIYEQIGEDRGRYFIEGLNLKKLTINSDTYDFYTQLMPLGKDNISIEWLGKSYIENYKYSKKKKLYVWKDERYTNTTSLLEDGTAKLEEMAKPYIAYEADIIDLASQNKKYSNVLDFKIGDTVMMVSKKKKTRLKQRIVKITKYPEQPKKNTIELSNTTKTFAQVQAEAEDQLKTEAISIANAGTKKTLQDGYYTKEEVESHITASKEEIRLGVSKTYETKTAVAEKIQEVNDRTDEKLTEYSTTEEMKSAINMKADEIDLSVSKTYETKTTVTEKINSTKEYAQSAADTAEQNANNRTDEKLTEYSTTEEMKSAINIKADEIDLSVTRKYEEKLKDYSTTEEMKAAINLKADGITTEVNKKVGTDEIISKINQSAEQIAIEAAKINFNGVVTANSNFIIGEDGKATMPAGRIGPFEISAEGLRYATGENVQSYINYDTIILSNQSAAIRLYPSVIRIAAKENGEEVAIFEINAGTREIIEAGDWTTPW